MDMTAHLGCLQNTNFIKGFLLVHVSKMHFKRLADDTEIELASWYDAYLQFWIDGACGLMS